MTQWADYSGGRPSGAALKAAGFSGAIRYVGLGSSGKRLAAGEYADLTAAGIQVLLVAESGTADAWGTSTDDDRARGRTNAQEALDDARSKSVPDSVGIAAAADAHAASQIQINDAVQYARGFVDVLGKSRTGFYGFSETLNAVHAAGVVGWFWRCGSEPTATEKTWVHFWQRNAAPTVRTVSGVSCDINEQYNPIGNNMAGFDATDFADLMWGNVFESSGNLNFAQWLKNVLLTGVNTANSNAAAANAGVAAVKTDVAAVKASVAALSVSGVDLDALAAKVAVLTPAIDYAALAKAVNDDAARRLAS